MVIAPAEIPRLRSFVAPLGMTGEDVSSNAVQYWHVGAVGAVRAPR